MSDQAVWTMVGSSLLVANARRLITEGFYSERAKPVNTDRHPSEQEHLNDAFKIASVLPMFTVCVQADIDAAAEGPFGTGWPS